MKLTAAQEDYLELISRLVNESPDDAVRVSDIAAGLGTRLPTVTRMVRKLADLGLLQHESRGTVALTADGCRMSQAIIHRHDDVLAFLTKVLGVSDEVARNDACRIEHGLSAETAQRLHEFLLYVERLESGDGDLVERFRSASARKRKQFRHLPDSETEGWRA